MTPENDHDDAAILHDLQADFPHLDISIEFLIPAAAPQPPLDQRTS